MIMDWISSIFSTAANWVSGVAGSAVAAVTGAALQGAVTGAVVGAAVAAVKGDDIFDSALKGAAYGGIAGGAASVLGQLTVMPADQQLEMMGVEKVSNVPTGILSENMSSDASTGSDRLLSTHNARDVGESKIKIGYSSADQPAPSKEGFFGMSDSTAKIVAGVGQGLASGWFSSSAAESTADSARELAREDEERRKARIAANQPGDYPPKRFKTGTAEGVPQQSDSEEMIKNWYLAHVLRVTPPSPSAVMVSAENKAPLLAS